MAPPRRLPPLFGDRACSHQARGPGRIGAVFDVAMAAVEDTLVNAVNHRSYEIRKPIKVRVLSDEITTCSCLHGELLLATSLGLRRPGTGLLTQLLSLPIVTFRALQLTPLQLQHQGSWDPSDEYWGEEGKPLPEWAQPILAQGPRPLHEMEHVIPGDDPEDPDNAITRSVDAKEAGDFDEAEAKLMKVLQSDLRCLDAHVHLGNLDFDRCPEKASRHYAMAQAIGELSFEPEFRGVLPWGRINNRPYLRSLNNRGVCLWRFGQLAQAAELFERLLWLNPSDNQGARFLLCEVRAGKTWEQCEGARAQ